MSVTVFRLDGDDFVRSQARLKGPTPPPGHVAVSETDYQTVQNGGLRIQGTDKLRWKYINGELEEQPDTRPTGVWSQTSIDADVGAAVVQVTLTLSPPVNGSRIFEFTSGHRLRLNFVAGVATLDLPTSKPFEAFLVSSPQVRLTNELRVRVLGNDIYPIEQ